LVLRSRADLDRIRKYAPELLMAVPELQVLSVNLQPEHKAILQGAQEIVLSSASTLTVWVNQIPLQLSAQSFFQTNTDVAAALYQRASIWLAALQPIRVLDLFCGVGGFALHAARALAQAQVVGVEISAEAISAARQSAAQLGLENVQFYAGDALKNADHMPAPDCVIVNPPRRGLGQALCRWLEQSAARDLIYSSCNLTTLVSDLAQLPSFGAVQAQLLDMFAHTEHFEVIVWLRRGA
jgi:23S rRNA (uracil747-C5)-methyltransferase